MATPSTTTPPSNGDRIRRNIDALRAQGATDDDVAEYLETKEGIKPTTSSASRARASVPAVVPESTAVAPAAAAAPAKPQDILGTAKAALAGAGQGATFGFADEILGGIDAANALLPKALGGEGLPLTHERSLTDVVLDQPGRGGWEGIKARYRQGRDNVRGQDAELAAEHGTAHLAGEVGGGIASAVAGGAASKALGLANVGKGAGALSRAARVMKLLGEGAAYGGLQAAGNADGTKQTTGEGALEGGILGAGTAAVLGTAGKVAKPATRMLLDAAPAIRNSAIAQRLGVKSVAERAAEVLELARGRGQSGRAAAAITAGAGDAADASTSKAPLARRIARTIDPSLEPELRGAQRAAETDAVTGAGNRAALDKALPAAEADPATSVIAFDANNFGKVNKLAGHHVGDQFIKDIGDALTQAAEEHGAGGRVFRRGGDEFVILAPTEKATAIRERAEQLFGERTVGAGDKAVQVSISGTHGTTFAEADAQLQAAKAARKAGKAAPAPTTPAAAAVLPKKPTAVIDESDNTRQLARSVYDTPSAGKDQLASALAERHEGQIGRRAQDLETLLGAKRENVFQTADDLITAQHQEATPLYDAAFAHGAVEDPELAQLLKDSPGLQRGWKHVEELNRETGKKLPQILRQAEEPMVMDGVALTGPDGAPITRSVTTSHEAPTVEALHELKLSVDREISDLSGSPYAKDRAKARALMDTQAKLVAIMDRATTGPDGVSAYGAARSSFAGHAKGIDAFTLGRDKFMRMDPREIEQTLAGMSEGERALFRRGAHDAYATAQEAVGPRGENSLAKMTLETSPERQRLAALFAGDDASSALAGATRDEAAMARTHAKVLGGSSTSTNQAGNAQHALDEAMAAAGTQALTGNHAGAVRTLWAAAKRRGDGISPAIADELAPMLLGTKPVPAPRGPAGGGGVLRRAAEALGVDALSPTASPAMASATGEGGPRGMLSDASAAIAPDSSAVPGAAPALDPQAAGQELVRLGVDMPRVRRLPGESARAFTKRERGHAARVTAAIGDTLASEPYVNAVAIAKQAIDTNPQYKSYRPASLAREIRRDMLQSALRDAAGAQ